MDNLIIKKLREYFLDCPVLDEFTKLNVDFLSARATEYTIEPVPSETIIKRYVDGGAVKQYLFVFASREFYGDDLVQNIENSGFYERLSTWVEKQNKSGNLPDLGDKKECIEISVQSSGYLFSADEKTARYQVQARLVYYED